jgi:hypothetical protein
MAIVAIPLKSHAPQKAKISAFFGIQQAFTFSARTGLFRFFANLMEQLKSLID